MLQLGLELHRLRLEERHIPGVIVHTWSLAKRVLPTVEELQTPGGKTWQARTADVRVRRAQSLFRLRSRYTAWRDSDIIGGRTHLRDLRILGNALRDEVLREHNLRRDPCLFGL